LTREEKEGRRKKEFATGGIETPSLYRAVSTGGKI